MTYAENTQGFNALPTEIKNTVKTASRLGDEGKSSFIVSEKLKIYIKNWDRKNIHCLAVAVKAIFDNDPESDFDLTDLPTEEEFKGYRIDRIADYPVWSMDVAGNCLVGNEFSLEGNNSCIEHISSVIDPDDF